MSLLIHEHTMFQIPWKYLIWILLNISEFSCLFVLIFLVFELASLATLENGSNATFWAIFKHRDTLLYMKIGMIRQQSKLCWAGKIAIMRRLFFEAFFEHHQDYNHTLDSKVGKSLITRPLTYQRESQSNASLANLILCDFTASWHKIQAGYY